MTGLILIFVESMLQHVLILCGILKVLCGQARPHLVSSTTVNECSLLLMFNRSNQVITSKYVSSCPIVDGFEVDHFAVFIEILK